MWEDWQDISCAIEKNQRQIRKMDNGIITTHSLRAAPLTTFFNYPVEIRRVMYTTNIIESVNSKFRKATGARRVFPSDNAVLKCLYMAAQELEKKWTRPIKDWSAIYAQLVLLFEDRVQ